TGRRPRTAARAAGLGGGGPDRRKARVACDVAYGDEAAAPERPESELEQALSESHVWAGEAEPGSRVQAAVFAEGDREPVDVEQLAHASDRGLEGVRERKLGDRLPDDREERARAAELGSHAPR